MKPLKDISDRSDIELLVHTFYDQVRADALLAPVFNKAIEDRWPEHLEKMVNFWEAVLLDGKRYFGRPFAPHASLPVNEEHFDRWLHLFESAVDRSFCGERADEAKWRASKMAVLFLNKLEYINRNPGKVIL